jgi:hypothetical protein
VRDQDQKKTTLLLSALKSVEISEEERLSANEIAILFPYHSDYEFIADQCAPSFTRIQGNDSAKVFKKVNTKIEIGETQSNVLFTPLSLVNGSVSELITSKHQVDPRLGNGRDYKSQHSMAKRYS